MISTYKIKYFSMPLLKENKFYTTMTNFYHKTNFFLFNCLTAYVVDRYTLQESKYKVSSCSAKCNTVNYLINDTHCVIIWRKLQLTVSFTSNTLVFMLKVIVPLNYWLS